MERARPLGAGNLQVGGDPGPANYCAPHKPEAIQVCALSQAGLRKAGLGKKTKTAL
jgi:hypothetical protein